MGEMYRYFLYLLIGGKGLRNLKSATFPSNIKLHEFFTLDKHGDKYIIAIFDAETEKDAENFFSYLASFQTQTKSGYLLPSLYQVEKFELGSK